MTRPFIRDMTDPLQERTEEDAQASHHITADWGSQLADISLSDEIHFSIHDKTHLEYAVHFPIANEQTIWESYFFAPQSLRLDQKTYGKDDLYSDLRAYYRYGVPKIPLAEMNAYLDAVVIGKSTPKYQPSSTNIDIELRLFCCVYRSALHRKRRTIRDLVRAGDIRQGQIEAQSIMDQTHAVLDHLRHVLPKIDCDEITKRWTDEDCSRVTEQAVADLCLELKLIAQNESHLLSDAIMQSLEAFACAEARYRTTSGIGYVATLASPTRALEKLEFRRHVVKRFTSSVLWLFADPKKSRTYIMEFFYAIAASIAMGIALVVAIWNGNQAEPGEVWSWVLVVILGYAVKDRFKAFLQQKLNAVVHRHFPDRVFNLIDNTRKHKVGEIDEQSGFTQKKDCPQGVLKLRRASLESAAEEEARPESIIWHRSTFEPEKITTSPFNSVTQIFRLDLLRWLSNTDDTKSEMVFADPEDNRVHRISVPRVYNISIIYRLYSKSNAAKSSWQRVRVVVGRKGIKRIEKVG